MIRILSVFAIVTTTFAGVGAARAQAPKGPTEAFLCGAKASQQRFVPGSAARRAFISRCLASSKARSEPTPEPRPQDRRPQPRPSPPLKK